MRRVLSLFLFALWGGVLMACMAPPPVPATPQGPPAVQPLLATMTPRPEASPTPTEIPPTTTLSVSPVSPVHPSSSEFWTLLFPGVEVRQTQDGLALLRHGPGLVQYDAFFQPDPQQAQPLSQWLGGSDTAWAAVNCGFYWEKEGAYYHMGWLEANAHRLAPPRPRWGAALVVRDYQAQVIRQPKKRAAPATLAVQGWPTLVWQGRTVAELAAVDQGTPARRTAVGVDAMGQVVWVADPQAITLSDFARRLQQPDIGLVEAINLDGGASTGLRWRTGPDAPQAGVESLPIPCVITLAPVPKIK